MTRLLLAAVVTLAILVILMRLAEFASHRGRNFKRRRSPASILEPLRLPKVASERFEPPYRSGKGCLPCPEVSLLESSGKFLNRLCIRI